MAFQFEQKFVPTQADCARLIFWGSWFIPACRPALAAQQAQKQPGPRFIAHLPVHVWALVRMVLSNI
jgi:hypothetical protein